MAVDKLPKIQGEYRGNFIVSPLTWFKVGGPADVLFKPADIDDLSYFLSNISPEIPLFVLGAGSNLIVRDSGIDGVVIKLGRGFADITIKDDKIVVGAGALNHSLAQFSLQNSIEGFEFLIGIPGSIGGGIAMNAGCYGKEFKDILHSVTMLDREGKKYILLSEDLGFGYRHNSLKNWSIFVEASFKYTKGKQEEIKKKIDEITSARQISQPINQKTGGSTFANPEGYKAWELIDKAGMRGYKIGGAEISNLHCNFMVNTGNATAADLENLGEKVRQKVLETSGVELKWEIKRIGKA
jgi:UDP-N-acetylmuramate dehydrogenase